MFIPNKMMKNISQKYIEGCPPFVLEILSPTTKKYDLGEKLEKYFRYGVKEYWVVEPNEEWLRVYLSKTKYKQYNSGKVISNIIDGFWINVEWLWEMPSENECLVKIYE